MPHKLVILISALISITLFVTSFFWFSIWGYGLLCFCLISFISIFIRIKYERIFEQDLAHIQIISGTFLFIAVIGFIGLAILAYSVTSDVDAFRMKPD